MNNDKLPKISVIIPVLNAYQSLEKAICSVLDQHYDNIELIILDAGSTDGTLDIIKRYESSIAYWHSRPDGSAYRAINLGIEQSTGDLIAQLMADDWFEPGTFHLMAQSYLENSDADIISCGGQIVEYDLKTKQNNVLASYTKLEQIKLNFYNVCFGVPAMSTRFFTRSLIAKVGLITPFDSEGKHTYSGDRDFLLRVVVNRCNSVHVNHLGHTYFAHSNSATFGKNLKTTLRIFEEHLAIAKSYLADKRLTKEQKSILCTWYNDQSIRLFLFRLLNRQYRLACNTALAGLQQTGLHWLIALFITPCKIAARKLRIRLSTYYKKHMDYDNAI